MINVKQTRSAVAVAGLCAAMLMAGCSGGGGSVDSMLASAKDYLAKRDTKAAVIQIKNALQKDPNSAEARFLLGSTLLDAGDFAAAEVELRKAQDLKYPADKLVPQLAQAMLSLGQAKKVTDEFSKVTLGTPQATAELQTTLATAYTLQKKEDLAQAALKAALAAQPDHAPALLFQARVKLRERDYESALAGADAILAKAPTNVEAWKLKADILYYVKNQPDEALAAYRKALEARPSYMAGHAGILTMLFARNDLEGAAKQLDQLKKLAPNHPQTRFFQAQLAYQKKDFKAARDLAQQLLKLAPNNPKSLQMAGAIEYQLNSLVQAEVFLSKAVAAAPDFVMARRFLVLTYLRLNQPAKALAALKPILEGDSVNGDTYSLAGEVYLQNGDARKAVDYFDKAAKLDPKDPRKRTSLALAHLQSGEGELAYGELREIAASDTGTSADLALISAYLKNQEYDKALKAIDNLEKKRPNNALAANLRGKTLLAKQDAAGARKAFERAVSLDPTYFPAVTSLASLDMADKKPDAAKKRFEDVLAKDPKNSQALLALAELAIATNTGKDSVIALMNKAITANPADAAPRSLLISYYLRIKDGRSALSTAQNAVAQIPDSPELLDALARAQMAAGETNQAITTYNKLANLQPQSPLPYTRLADVYMSTKNVDGAIQSLKKGLEIKPDMVEIQRAMMMLYLGAKKYPEAVAVARSVQKQRPKEAVGYLLEGDAAVTQKNWDAASAAFSAGLKEAPVSDLAIKQYSVLLAAGRGPEAAKFAETWMKQNPNDADFVFYLGDGAIARKDYPAAEKYYTQVTKLQPGNAMAFNNLAWVTGRLGKDGAIPLAETANKLGPNQPAFMDTLAMLWLDKNNPAKALEWQTKAVALQPNNAYLNLNLAKIQVKLGQKEQARKTLTELAKLGDKFGAQAEVAGLLKTL